MISILKNKLGTLNGLVNLNYIVRAAASIVALCSFNVRGDTMTQEDVHLWIKEAAPQTTKADDDIYYATSEFSTHFISPSYAIVTPNTSVNDYGFKESYKKIAKANEKKLLRRISDKLKISLFKASDKHSNHRVYINTLKRELVGKSRIGKAKYEIRVSEKQAEAHFGYTF